METLRSLAYIYIYISLSLSPLDPLGYGTRTNTVYPRAL